MEDQSAVKVRFNKKNKLAFWQIFGEMNAIRLKHISNQIALFNSHHEVKHCVVDFSETTFKMSHALLTKSIRSNVMLTGKSQQQVHIIMPKQMNDIGLQVISLE